MLDLDMSPYAAFVWPAWAITVLVLGGLVVRALTASRRWKAELERLEAEGVRDDQRPQVAQSVVGLSKDSVQGAKGPTE